jgi:hypothetical protein
MSGYHRRLFMIMKDNCIASSSLSILFNWTETTKQAAEIWENRNLEFSIWESSTQEGNSDVDL